MSFCKEFNAKTAGFLVSDQYFHNKTLQRKFPVAPSSLTYRAIPFPTDRSARTGDDHRVQR